jgi:DNA-binding response OmpR family regulator
MDTIQHKQRDKVLVIDDDTRLLELLAISLEDSGFDVTALPTSDEAYALLRKFIPDLILCDINLETSTMGGFTFYEKVQELKNIQSIPFVFLTGLTDEALVRTGKELGVDDYLMKPISEQTLVATLRGKLKRFRQLNKIMADPISEMAAA